MQMNETLNSLRPYSFFVDEDMRYTFTTDEGIVYHAYFLDYSMFMPQFSNIYMFNIEPEEETAHPIDIRISHTIITILAKFFERNVNTMIMVCDNLDGKEHKRNMLFDRWYQKYGTSEIEKFDASAETEDPPPSLTTQRRDLRAIY